MAVGVALPVGIATVEAIPRGAAGAHNTLAGGVPAEEANTTND